ncbi:EscU/YscU/HrcU family type III secretion system export apparatus switch protein [Sulfurihydrogenibium sp. YO3AOP1]|uniref:EscU/YscU/HrcU family type III secretion system export apparatus switch protein n=1 Tax=Sulfurihydrogenibium sp. (strain YO3AOP1) TaxID=436114 RepID=UPI0002D3DFD3|nr:EscU/YscU/HrcU family type III secretion system export apparatus switch protein [Sulfurihydrogenibium sp. YO3AOP1]
MDEKKAVALRYERYRDSAPKVVAKGKGIIAERIIEVAKQHGVYLKEDPTLVEVLSGLELYEEIPEELYKVIAEIFVLIYQAKQKR